MNQQSYLVFFTGQLGPPDYQYHFSRLSEASFLRQSDLDVRIFQYSGTSLVNLLTNPVEQNTNFISNLVRSGYYYTFRPAAEPQILHLLMCVNLPTAWADHLWSQDRSLAKQIFPYLQGLMLEYQREQKLNFLLNSGEEVL